MGILDLFVERSNNTKKKEKTPIQQDPPQPLPTYIPPTGGNLSQFSEHFNNLLKDENSTNFPGNDFYEFIMIRNSMVGIPEQQAYQAAFNGLAATGVTKDQLLQTGAKYLNVVEREMENFDSSFKEVYKKEVLDLQNAAKEKDDEIKRLQEKIISLMAESSKLSTDSNTNAMKLNQKAEGFKMAGNSKKTEIQNEISKINQYIQ